MLRSMSSTQFARWMAFYHAESEIRREAAETAALEREALAGVDEMRERE